MTKKKKIHKEVAKRHEKKFQDAKENCNRAVV
jgi:hypothetical protein